MPSVAELYNQEVLDGHREALAALRELLAAEKDPLERRKLANAILRARRVKIADPEVPHPKERAAVRRDEDMDLGFDDDDLDQDEREVQATVDGIVNGRDRDEAILELHALMNSTMSALKLPGRPAESS